MWDEEAFRERWGAAIPATLAGVGVVEGAQVGGLALTEHPAPPFPVECLPSKDILDIQISINCIF